MEETYLTSVPSDIKREILYSLEPPYSIYNIEKAFDYEISISDCIVIFKKCYLEKKTDRNYIFIFGTGIKSLYETIINIEKVDNMNYSNYYKNMLDIMFNKYNMKSYIENPLFERICIYNSSLEFYTYINKYLPIQVFDKYHFLFRTVCQIFINIITSDAKLNPILYLFQTFKSETVPSNLNDLISIYSHISDLFYINEDKDGHEFVILYLNFLNSKMDQRIFSIFIKEYILENNLAYGALKQKGIKKDSIVKFHKNIVSGYLKDNNTII